MANSGAERVLQHGNYRVGCTHVFGKWMSLENGEELRVCKICGEARIRKAAQPHVQATTATAAEKPAREGK